MNEAQAIALLSENTPQREIAKQTGMSQPTISRINQKHKELIQSKQAELVEKTLETITNQTIREIKLASELTDKDILAPGKQAALSRIDKKAEMILKSVGIAPSNSTSIHIQNIFNDNRTTLISPTVSNILDKFTENIIDIND